MVQVYRSTAQESNADNLCDDEQLKIDEWPWIGKSVYLFVCFYPYILLHGLCDCLFITPPRNRGGVVIFTADCLCVCLSVCLSV